MVYVCRNTAMQATAYTHAIHSVFHRHLNLCANTNEMYSGIANGTVFIKESYAHRN